MGVEGGETVAERLLPKPGVEPESRSASIPDSDHGVEAKGGEARKDAFPDGGVEEVAIPKIAPNRPTILAAEPSGPRRVSARVKFGEEF